MNGRYFFAQAKSADARSENTTYWRGVFALHKYSAIFFTNNLSEVCRYIRVENTGVMWYVYAIEKEVV